MRILYIVRSRFLRLLNFINYLHNLLKISTDISVVIGNPPRMLQLQGTFAGHRIKNFRTCKAHAIKLKLPFQIIITPENSKWNSQIVIELETILLKNSTPGALELQKTLLPEIFLPYHLWQQDFHSLSKVPIALFSLVSRVKWYIWLRNPAFLENLL